MFNPAAAISQVVAGNLGPGQFFNVIAGEMVGAFLGGLTIYFLYMPQLYKAGEKVRGLTVAVCCVAQLLLLQVAPLVVPLKRDHDQHHQEVFQGMLDSQQAYSECGLLLGYQPAWPADFTYWCRCSDTHAGAKGCTVAGRAKEDFVQHLHML
jgi:hypothetical protein